MNTSLFFFLYNLAHKSSWFDLSISFIAGTADKVVLLMAIIYLVLFFIIHKDWKHKGFISWIQESFIIGMSVFSAWLVSFIIKIIAHVPRPFITYPDIVTLIAHEPTYDSFPSGHSTIFFGLATAIYLYDKRVGCLFYISAFLIAISRVIAGVHYPIDIIIGAIIGIGISYIIHRILSSINFLKIKNRLSK